MVGDVLVAKKDPAMPRIPPDEFVADLEAELNASNRKRFIPNYSRDTGTVSQETTVDVVGNMPTATPMPAHTQVQALSEKKRVPAEQKDTGISAQRAARVLGIPSMEQESQATVTDESMPIAAQAGAVSLISDIPRIRPPSGRKEGPTPLDLVKKMKSCLIMIVRDKTLYCYLENYYMALDQSDAETLIWSFCREEVEKAGSRSILSGAYQMLLVDPDLKGQNLLPADGLIPFRNGLLRLADGMLLPHSPIYFINFVVQCDYTSAYGCPVFEQYLRDVTGEDPQLMDRIWEFIGCCLTKVDIKRIFVVQGRTNGGKSVLINILKHLFPGCVQSYLNAHDLGKEFSMIEYKGKQLCVCSDMKSGYLDETAVSNLKKASGRDTMNTNVKYGSYTEFEFKGKIVLVTNHPILTKQYDEAFWARLVAIPFFYSISAEKEDRNLEQKVRAELPAIAYKAVQAFYRLHGNNYRFSGEFPVNSPQLYDDVVPAADPATLVYLFLQKYFESGTDADIIAIEEACKAFNELYHVAITPIQFSAFFCAQAAQMYGAEKVRSRVGGYKNARSCLKNIRVKH